MTTALIIGTEDFYFKYGALSLTNQTSNYDCIELEEVSSFEEILRKYRNIYIVCKIKNFFLYSPVFLQKSVECICTSDITLHQGEIFISVDRQRLSAQSIYNLSNLERLIIYLYCFQHKKIKDIALFTNLSIGKIYYRIRSIKIKLGVDTKHNLSLLCEKFYC